MPTIAEQNSQDTELMYTLLQEGKLDLMYLPSGVIAWLWDRPESQINAARDLAVATKDTCPVTDGALLRSDQNVLVLKCEDGHRFNVYPDGGYGCDGQPLDIHGCMKMLDGGMEPMEPEECPMEGGGAPEPGMQFMTPDSLAADTADQVVGVTESIQGIPVDDPNFVKKASRYLALKPDEYLRGAKSHMQAFADQEETKEIAQKAWLNFSKAMYNEDYLSAARIWQDYHHTIYGGRDDYLMAGEMSEAREISLKELTVPELRNWIRKMRDQLSPQQFKGIKRLLQQKMMDELGTDPSGGPMRQWQTEEEGGEALARDRQDRGVDLICKMRSVGSPLQKALKAKESEGSQGDAGPIGTDLFDFEDELPEIEMMVGEEMKKYED